MSVSANEIYQDVGFVHLHVHSSFSLLEGALTIAALSKMAIADGMPALALTDSNNLFGALEFSEKLSGAGIQPIAGLQLTVEFEPPDPTVRQTVVRSLPHIVLLATSEAGYGNLMQLTSRAFLDSTAGEVTHVPFVRLAAHSEGLIALTGGPGGPLDRALRDGQVDLASERFGRLREVFGDRLYVELQRHGTNEERSVETELLRLAYRDGVPLVATNEPYFAKVGDYEAHDALLAIADGRLVTDDNRRRLTNEHDFKSRAAMVKLFEDLPEALQSTVEIAMRCAYRPRTRKPMLPRFSGDEAEEASELRRQAVAGLDARLASHPPAPGLTEADYRQRLEFELSIIERMRFPGYFLIVADFIKWAKAHDIPVGPGRGSGAGSLVAYSLTITDLDPLRFGLLFERFLNPDRVSMPDFDIDFCQDRREEVISYVQQRYGEDRVAQIITFGTLQARGVMRDVGRVLEMPYGQVDKLTKLVPQNPANPVTLKKAIEDEPKLQSAAKEEPVVGRMLDIAQKLEGLHRHASTHAAGIVIGDRPLEELVPLYRDPRSGMRVSQLNMKWVEQAGLVKFDFLGLKTLTVLRTAVDLIKKKGLDIDLSTIPLDDKKTYEYLGRGETVGVFQVESAGMRKALVEMRADRLEDLIALVALYRPGPMANIPVYCARKHGDGEPEEEWYLHEKLQPILNETFGIIIYQEQVMQVAQSLSGYSLGEADLLRRAMGKKIKAEMDAQRERFVDGAIERGLTKALADEIFDLLAKFADYGFNKSHAAAYALVSYHTGYLKANHPVEFMAASMTLELDNTDKLSEFRREAERLGIKVEPPSINRSGVVFEVHYDADKRGSIRYALAALKGVGRQAVEALVAARGDTPFRDLGDFARRFNPKLVNKRTLEALISAGAFDELEPDRARSFAAIDAITAIAARTVAAEADGQNDFFGGPTSAPEPLRIPTYVPWLPAERLQREYDAAGFFLTGHPLDEYGALLEKLRVQRWSDFAKAVRGGVNMGRLAATVLDRTERRTKSGSKMGIVNLSDQSGHFEAIIFAEGLSHFRDLLEPGKAVILLVQASAEGEEVRARIQSVEPLDSAVSKHHKSLRIFLRDEAPLPIVAERLRDRGDGDISLVLMLEEKQEVEVKLKGRFSTTPQMASAIRAIPGVVHVEML
ncbi:MULTISPECIES: DNA polymerase III subunit alpha [unclassified Chelatococcus]|jgi:DNA polymerase-3 subunit alpha|uniref:DNA polymerase III subunit alpha n=1 Tax=unclassified Chelatococcus TaxID=2638111 RepID=UPI001BD1AEAF|nr:MULTISPECIES: DNA polymerase III subunit alpha [unclassified Chelatococcus]CAH1673203.1 DNA polymerase III subunit alpha [Hyphomicrobiales bacterium]MBS7738686.1 DNA polymerase III subunit alpha [Chelatococcus sp. HY11]MBX3543090.1 DNA polymerase III subunit alpha [Chelatococcus sp.]MCO5076784.1 DNA polymerase III subunit alpha [Chelatococcus sp.]CAH1674557.1 DNA polymerase III subunit alpha [Hyphomicrobiales bacterium]